MKNLHQYSPHHERERRYPVLVAIDLMLHFALCLVAIVLGAIALAMIVNTIWPGLLHIPGL